MPQASEPARDPAPAPPRGPSPAPQASILALLGGNLVAALVGGLFFLTASWVFDLEQMGIYAVAISVQWVLVGLVGSGLSVATIRLVTDRLTRDDRKGAAGIVAAAITLASAITLLIALAGLTLGWLGIRSALLSPGLLALIALWGGARSVLDCERSGLLAQRQYGRAAALTLVSALTGLAALAWALTAAELTIERLLVAHVLGLGASTVLGALFLRSLWRGSRVELSRGSVRELLGYAPWPALSEGTRLLQVNFGPLLLVALAGSAQAGLFSLGRYPAYLFEVVAVSLYQYWLPEGARESGRERLLGFLRRQAGLAGAVGAMMLVGAVALRPLLPWLGPNFAAAAPLLLLNTLDFALFLLVRPFESVFHAVRKPQLELVLRLVRLPILVVLAVALAGRSGASGMVSAHVLAGVAGLGLAAWLVRRALRDR